MRAQWADQQAARESDQAQVLLDDFLARAAAAGPPPVALMAKTPSGRLVKTSLTGWYLRNDHTVAIGTDGGYYVLTVAGGLMAGLRGASPERSAPPLIVGRGGKDGESGDLKDFLARVLAGDVR